MLLSRLLIVGLGNPGPTYAGHRHNVGFMAVDAIMRRHGFGRPRSRFQGEFAEGVVAGRKVLALKPMTYMNESGRSVGEVAQFFRIPPTDILVFHDELDLACGKVRCKQGGGSAGHNGLKSIDAAIGPDYSRVRIGVGRPEDKDRVLAYVLKDFSKADALWLEPLLDAVAEHFPLLVEGDTGAFMSKVALTVNPPKSPRAERAEPAEPPDNNGL